MKTVFLRVRDAEDKGAALFAAIHDPAAARGRQRFEVDAASFAAMPRSPFAYWVSDRVRRLFKELPQFETKGRTARQGLATSNDFRFARAWWEVPPSTSCVKWFPFAKGGAFSPFYADVALVANWELEGIEIKAEVYRKYPNVSDVHWVVKNSDFYLRPGLTWSRRPHLRGSFQLLPTGCIFGSDGPAAFSSDLQALSAILNSATYLSLLGLLMARGTSGGQTLKYETGYVTSVPIPRMTETCASELANLARRAWSLKRSLDTCTEASHAFTLPRLLQVRGADVATRAAAWAERVRTVEGELVGIQAEIDERCFALYGIDEADRRTITEDFGTLGPEELSSDDANGADEDDAGEDDDENESTADVTRLAAELVSWAVGVAFGRFDMRLATGERPMPTEPEPFDPLPACSPGMLAGGDSLPVAQQPAGYPLAFPEAGVLVDDLGDAQDLPTAVRAVFDAVFGASADRWWNDVAALLDPKGHDPRVWFAGSFFEHHLKRHSKSRRKAPIVWQLGTHSGRYSVWLYAHRLTRDSFFQLQNEVVGPKLTHEERQLTRLMQNAGGSPSAPERKEIAAQETLVEELRAMLEEVKRIAPLWQPDLDDGITITMAPLWRLVTKHSGWQKELRATWDTLCARKYDWTHLAMHLWPERVVPKCAEDHSFAIAHGLENVLWIEGGDNKWLPRKVDRATIETLIKERTSLAVKDALKSLLDAPAPIGARGAGRADSGRRASTKRTPDGRASGAAEA